MERYVMIAGSNYSGSTLLAILLGGHPRIATVGELTGLTRNVNVGNYKCSCGEDIQECEFWLNVKQRMREKGEDLNYNDFNTRYKPSKAGLFHRLQFSNLRSNRIEEIRDLIYGRFQSCREYRSEITKRNINLASAILDMEGKSIFVDSSKTPDRVKPFHDQLDEKLLIIHLVRNGRSVVNSRKKYYPNVSTKDAAVMWKNINERVERVIKYVSPTRRLFLRYEDLTSRPEDCLKRITNFIGVDYDNKCLSVNSNRQHIIGNNGARLSRWGGVKNEVGSSNVENSSEGDEFDQVAGTMNRKYGYK